MDMRAIIVISVFLLFSQLSLVNSQTCCSGGVPVSGNIGLFPLAGAGFQLNFSYDYNLLRTLKDFSETLDDINRERITHSMLLEASYSLTDRLSFYGLLSFVSQERTILNSFTRDFQRTRGLGDAVFMPGYLVMNRPNLSWLLSAGAKFPVGRSDIRDSNGILLNPDLQPGSGAFDGLFLSMIRLESSRGNSFWNQIAFRRTGTNTNFRNSSHYRFGNELVASAGWSKNFLLLSQIFEPSLILSYRFASNDLIDRKKMPNTGGNWIFASAGIAFYLNENLKFFSSLSLPVFSEPAGVQLSTTMRMSAGIYFAISKSQNVF